MISGIGVTHSERSVVEHKTGEVLHGLQFWMALPKHLEDVKPEFHHSPSVIEIPNPRFDVQVKLIIGSVFGYEQHNIPMFPGMDNIFLMSVELTGGDSFYKTPKPFPRNVEVGVYVVSGKVRCNDNEVLGDGEMMVMRGNGADDNDNDGALDLYALEPSTRVVVFGGTALPEKRHLLWNFCSSDTNKIKSAVESWKTMDRDKFPPVVNEPNDDSISMP